MKIKKKINKNLLHSLILSDFLLLNKKIVTNFGLSYALFSSINKAFHLNALLILQSLKIFLRLFQFLRKHYNAGVYLWTDNEFSEDFFMLFFRKFRCSTNFCINSNVLKDDSYNRFSLSTILCFGETSLTPNLNRLFNSHNFLLIQKINIFLKNSEHYFLQNNINTNQKLLFLSIFMLQILKKKV